MRSHVEDGDVAGSPAVPPAEQDPMKVRVISWSSDVSLTSGGAGWAASVLTKLSAGTSIPTASHLPALLDLGESTQNGRTCS